MDDPLISGLEIVLLVALVLANGFFVAAELALVRARESELGPTEGRARWGRKAASRLLLDLDQSLSVTQIGITIASLLLGWFGIIAFDKLFVVLFANAGEQFAPILSAGVSLVLALLLVTFVHVVFGELIAKSLAGRYPELALRLTAPPMVLFSFISMPFLFICAGAAKLALRAFGVEVLALGGRVHSTAELAHLISQSTADGVLDKEEERMLQGVFEFSDTVAREVMTPRTDLVAVPIDVSFDELIKKFTDSGFSRLPVIGETVDDVVGITLVKDLLNYVSTSGPDERRRFDVTKCMRKAYFIPGTKPIDVLLAEFKKRKIHIAIVIDEHGGVDGVVTLEDLLEEIVGDIFDESDVPENEIVVKDSGEIVADGGVLVSDLNARFELKIPIGDYDTIAGFIITFLGRFPEEGERIVLGPNGSWPNGDENGNGNGPELHTNNGPELEGPGVVLTIRDVDGHRLETIAIELENPYLEAVESDPLLAASDKRDETS